MLISAIFKSTTISCLFQKGSFLFARTTDNKTRFTNKADEFENLQKESIKNYFEEYRKEVENDTVIRDFRKQIFDKNNEPPGYYEREEQLDKQQKHLNQLLNKGSREEVAQYSRKIMQHFINEKNMFKGRSDKTIFKDYANYSAYKTNTLSVEDRNYANMDNFESSSFESRTYGFIDSLPETYEEKSEVRRQIEMGFPFDSANMSISEYGKRLQDRHDVSYRMNEGRAEKSQENWFKDKIAETDMEDTVYQTTEQMLDAESYTPFQLGILSTDAMNTIYDLYIQGWSVREISRRYGILPTRAKFVIWNRARLFTEFVPRNGLKFLFYVFAEEQSLMETNNVIDYGLDLDEMRKSEKFEEITSWTKHHVDVQRTAPEYTEALHKLEKHNKFTKFDLLQVGTEGTENSKYLLKEWIIHRGKKSNAYFLKNKVFRGLMEERRKNKKVYY